LVDPSLAAQLTAVSSGEAESETRVANPQSVEQSVLRPNLLGSLLLAVRSNLRQRDRILLFELARTWHVSDGPSPIERRHVGIAMVGPRYPRHWSTPEGTLDFFDAKGV